MTTYDATTFPGKTTTMPGAAKMHYWYGHDITDQYNITDRDGVARIIRRRAEQLDEADPGTEPIVLDAEWQPTGGFSRLRQDRRKPLRGETQEQCDAAVVAAAEDIAHWVRTLSEVTPRQVLCYQGIIIWDPINAGRKNSVGWHKAKHEEWKVANGLLWGTSLRRVSSSVYVPGFAFTEADVVNGWWEEQHEPILEEAWGTGLPPTLQLSPFDFRGLPLSPASVLRMYAYAMDQGVDVVWWQSGWAWANPHTTPPTPPLTWEVAREMPNVRAMLECCAGAAGGVE